MSRWESLLAVQATTPVSTSCAPADTLPERAELVAVGEQVARRRRASWPTVDERRGELSRSQQRLEDEIASLTERANQAEKQLYSGAVSDPRELQALQDDVASIRRRIGQIEDDELEIMELSEPVDAERASSAAERERLDGETQRLTAELAEAEAEIAAELTRSAQDAAGRRRPRRSPTTCGPSTTAASPARRRRHRPAGRHDLPGLPPGAVGRRGRPHPQAGRRRARALRGVRPPPRARLTRAGPACSSGSPAARSSLVWLVFRSPAVDYRLVMLGRCSRWPSCRSACPGSCTA